MTKIATQNKELVLSIIGNVLNAMIRNSREFRVKLALSSSYIGIFFFGWYYFNIYLYPHQIKYIRRHERSRELLILTGAGHGKTVAMSFIAPMRQICRNRDIRILMISVTAVLAQKNGMLLREELENNHRLNKDFGKFYDRNPHRKWTNTGFQIIRDKKMKDFTVECAGFLKSITGSRYDIIYFDDIIDYLMMIEEKQRQKVKAEISGTILPRLVQNGIALAVGTRKHADDVYEYLMTEHHWPVLHDKSIIRFPKNPDGSDGWRVLELKEPRIDEDGMEVFFDIELTSDDQGECLCPELMPMLKLLRLRHKLKAVFYREFQNEIVDDEFTDFKMESLEKCRDFNRSYIDGNLTKEVRDRYKYIVIGVDPSLVTSTKEAEKRDTSYMVQKAIGVTKRNDREVIGYERFRGLSPKEKIEKFVDFYYRFNPDVCGFESNSFGTIYITMVLDEDKNIKIKPHHTGKKKSDVYEGVPGLSILVENQSISWPYATAEDRKRTDKILQEFHQLGMGKHDDIVMATWIADTRVQKLLTREARRRKRQKQLNK